MDKIYLDKINYYNNYQNIYKLNKYVYKYNKLYGGLGDELQVIGNKINIPSNITNKINIPSNISNKINIPSNITNKVNELKNNIPSNITNKINELKNNITNKVNELKQLFANGTSSNNNDYLIKEIKLNELNEKNISNIENYRFISYDNDNKKYYIYGKNLKNFNLIKEKFNQNHIVYFIILNNNNDITPFSLKNGTHLLKNR